MSVNNITIRWQKMILQLYLVLFPNTFDVVALKLWDQLQWFWWLIIIFQWVTLGYLVQVRRPVERLASS